jgi:hypothetical protein
LPAAPLLVAVLVTAAGCAPIRRVQPVDVGEHVVAVGFGGPITEIGRGTGAYVPAPILTAGYGYGLHRIVDLDVGLQLSELVVGGLALDAGVNVRPLRPDGARPGVIIPVKLHYLLPFRGDGVDTMRLYPEVGATAAWKLGDRPFYTYVGFQLWFDLASRGDGNDVASRVLPSFHLGQTVGTEVWQFSLELRYYTPNVGDDFRLVDVADLGGAGALGVLMGFSIGFGGGER